MEKLKTVVFKIDLLFEHAADFSILTQNCIRNEFRL